MGFLCWLAAIAGLSMISPWLAFAIVIFLLALAYDDRRRYVFRNDYSLRK